MKDEARTDESSTLGGSLPLDVQWADRHLYPPEVCSGEFASSLPAGIEVWSCRPGQYRFVERLSPDLQTNLAGYDQQRSIYYTVVSDAKEGLANHMRSLAAKLLRFDVGNLVGSKLSPPPNLQLSIRGGLMADGQIAGSSVYLINADRGLMCNAAVPNTINPFTVCDVAAAPALLNLQLPNRELPKLDHYLARLQDVARLVGAN